MALHLAQSGLRTLIVFYPKQVMSQERTEANDITRHKTYCQNHKRDRHDIAELNKPTIEIKPIFANEFIILLSFLKVIISDIKEIDLDGINAAASPHDFNLDEDMCVKFLVKLNDEQKKNENLYVRISVDSNDVEDMNRQQLYYSTESCPTSSDAEQYSLRASKHPNIFAKYNNSSK